MDFFIASLITVIIIIFLMICAAGVIVTGIFIIKITEKIIKIIENFFNNL